MKKMLKYSQKANSVLGIIRKGIGNKPRTLLCYHINENCIHLSHAEDSSNLCASSLLKKHRAELEKVQRSAVEMIKGMKQLIY